MNFHVQFPDTDRQDCRCLRWNLEQEKTKGKAGQIAESLTKLDLAILDELGYLPFSTSGGALLFQLLSKLYERTSVLITTNQSFSEGAVRRRSRAFGEPPSVMPR